MKKILMGLLMAAVTVIFSGCGPAPEDLPANPVIIEFYQYPPGSEYGYSAFDYNGRTYISYASRHNNVPEKHVGTYLGVRMYNGEVRDGDWVVSLKDFENEDILLLHYPFGVMEPEDYYRAEDTKGQILEWPDHLWYDWLYGYWEE